MSALAASSDKVQFRLLFLACVIEVCCCYLVFLGDLQRQIPQMWTGVFSAFLCYVFAAYFVLRRDAALGRPHLILGAALVFRLRLWWSPATLSDDIFRYVWDGRVQLAGINPYLYAPSAPQVEHLRDALYQSVNHADIPTIYPPLAQLFFSRDLHAKRDASRVQIGPAALRLGPLPALGIQPRPTWSRLAARPALTLGIPCP